MVLPWPGIARVGGAEDERQEQGQQAYGEGDLAGPDECVESPGDPGDHSADHVGAGEIRRHRRWSPRTLPGLAAQFCRALVERGGQGVLGVLAQLAGGGGRRYVGLGDPDALARGGHLVPADAGRVVVRSGPDVGGLGEIGRGRQ